MLASILVLSILSPVDPKHLPLGCWYSGCFGNQDLDKCVEKSKDPETIAP